MYYICPIILFILIIIIRNWLIYGYIINIYYLNYSLLILIIILTIIGYIFIILYEGKEDLFSLEIYIYIYNSLHYCRIIYGKNDFVEIFKNLTRDRSK